MNDFGRDCAACALGLDPDRDPFSERPAVKAWNEKFATPEPGLTPGTLRVAPTVLAVEKELMR